MISFRALALSLFLLCGSVLELRATDAELVRITDADKTIQIELRYATTRNLAQRPLYRADMPALVRPHVAANLARAQEILRAQGYGLKIWDAWRPQSAHEMLWALLPNPDYVQDPAMSGSLHTYGVAVDATLVDKKGREVRMPTDFDSFTAGASLNYRGDDVEVRRNLHRLQNAMARAGFYGLRTEWWHFIAKDWKNYAAISEIDRIPRATAVEVPARALQVTPGDSANRSSARPTGGNLGSPPRG